MEITQKQYSKLATKDDLKKFATKDDLKKFVTKNDLKKFATKDDLKKFATKDDLKKFVTKDDLKKIDKRMDKMDERANKISIAVLDNKDSIEKSGRRIEEKLGAKIDGFITAVDNINKKYEDHEIEHVANIGAHDRMEENIKKHDGRIGKLELKVV